jgi:hypothetical protein
MGTHICVGTQVAHEGGELFEEFVGAVADGRVAPLGDVVEGEEGAAGTEVSAARMRTRSMRPLERAAR